MAASDPTEANAPLLTAFAGRVAALDADAWDRIGTRCSLLDRSTVTGMLGRAELLSRAFVPQTDPYTQPLARSTLAALGTLAGLFVEVGMLLGPADPVEFEKAAERHRTRQSPKPQLEPFFRLMGEGHRQRLRHPGAAAALFAVSFMMLTRRFVPDTEFRALYAPFEPDIPYDTLAPGSEQPAA